MRKQIGSDKIIKGTILILINIGSVWLLGYSAQSTDKVYETGGYIENLSVKKTGYVAVFRLKGNRLKFELRVAEKKAKSYVGRLGNGDDVKISYLKPCFGKAAVVGLVSEELNISRDEQIEIYKEDRMVHAGIIIAFLAVTLVYIVGAVVENIRGSHKTALKKE